MGKTLLRECDIFRSLAESDLDRVARLASPREYQAGSTIFSEGNSSNDLFVLESGKVALQIQLPAGASHPGRRVSVDIVTSKEAFGWSALVEPFKYTLMAVCIEPTRVLAIDSAGLRSLLDEDKRIGFQVMKRLIVVVASRLEETRHVLVSERLAATVER